jgi:hypothetical protein
MDNENTYLENYCYYSDLPSPMAYVDNTTDYDGMGNQGRFPESRKKEKSFMKKLIQKIIFWFSIKKKSKRKSIWEL